MAFTTMLGSAEKAKAFMAELYEFAKRTPFEMSGLLSSVRLLMAFEFQAEETISALTAIGDATAAFGGNAEMMERITIALGQMKTMGKVTGNEMRQLAQNNIPAWAILAEGIGKTTAETMKLSEAGKISAEVGIPALLGGMTKRFGGMMDVQSRMLIGRWSTLKDAISKILRDLGFKLIDTFKLDVKLKGAVEWIEKNGKKIESWLTTLAEAAGNVGRGFLLFVQGLAGKDTQINDLGDAIGGLAEQLRGLSVMWEENAEMIGGFIHSIGAVLRWIDSLLDRIVALGLGLESLAHFAMGDIRGARNLGRAAQISWKKAKGEDWKMGQQPVDLSRLTPGSGARLAQEDYLKDIRRLQSEGNDILRDQLGRANRALAPSGIP